MAALVYGFRSCAGSTVAVLGLALLVAASVGAVGLATALSAADGTPPEVIETPNSTSYVAPDAANLTRQEYEEVDLDVGAAMATDAERLQGRHDELLITDLGTESSDGARTTVGVLEARVTTLERRHERVLQNYSDGDISTETLLTELARIEVAARQYRGTIDQLGEADLSDSLAKRVAALSVEPTVLDQPVTERVVQAKTTGTESVRVYVGAADDGIVAATVIEDRYVRQATLRGERDPFGDDQFVEDSEGRAQAASNRASTIYSSQTDTVRGFAGTHVYEFRANHSLGQVFAYLDGATTNPFHETGPMAIFVTGASGLSPITISIDGQQVGTIDGGGEIWTIQPMGEFTVTAETEDDQSVSVQVSP
ncbi:hypothetical protein BRC73_03315 [Halobacteriales archaeon QH_7_66_37]|nr:MAG: hypothetical protein BRC73_03315 [Halobacteriales archaeon QH_7_66_37]